MPLKPSSRLPRRFNRPVSKGSRALVEKRLQRRKEWRKERFRRIGRRLQRIFMEWQHAFRMWFLVGLGGVVLLLVGLVLFSPIVEVRSVSVIRTDPRLDIEQVQKLLVPMFGRHLLFLTEQEIDELLRAGVPDIATVAVEKDYPSILTVRITLDPIVARLHIDDPEAIAAGQTATGSLSQDFLTEEGMYVSYPMAEGEEDLWLIQLVDWGVRPAPGTPLIDPALLERMRAAEQILALQFGQQTVARTVFLRAKEFHLRLDGLSLWFDMASTLEEQIQRYRIFLRTVGTEKVTQYIDLRLADRVVYR